MKSDNFATQNETIMRRQKAILFIICHLVYGTAGAQDWTARQCMQYAVEHNHVVKRAELELDNYKAAKVTVVGSFLPSVSGSTGVQYNFGRAIDPETNGYTDNALKAAKASVLMGHNALREQQDQTALATLQAFANAAYYEGMVRMAEEKVEEATLLLKQTQVMEEVGRKSAADVAQVESQKAEADYELTRQQNLYASALLELKKEMAFPINDSLTLNLIPTREEDRITTPLSSRKGVGGEAVAYYQMQASKYEWRQARAALLPSLSLSAGLSTTYYKTLHSQTSSFSSQFKNNMGEYVGATLSIPVFNRLQTVTKIRRARNNYRIACEAYEQKQIELEKLSREAWQDWQGFLKQMAQMEKKVEADSLAYQLTRRQYEEGLSTAIDLHTTSTQLLQSRATLLQCQLMAMLKHELVRYYQGETIWTE